MSRPFITAIIPHYYEPRIKNLPKIIQSLVGVDDVIIWNNDNSIPRPEGSVVIQADQNYGCQGRFKAVEYVHPSTTHVLFHDNDLILPDSTLTDCFHLLEAFPGTIPSVRTEPRVHFSQGVVLISRAQFELIEISVLRKILKHWTYGDAARHDDIWLSVMAYRLSHLVVPVSVEKIKWREQKVGFRRTKSAREWEAERQSAFETLMEVMPHEDSVCAERA